MLPMFALESTDVGKRVQKRQIECSSLDRDHRHQHECVTALESACELQSLFKASVVPTLHDMPSSAGHELEGLRQVLFP